MATASLARWALLGLGGVTVAAGGYLFAPDLWRRTGFEQTTAETSPPPSPPVAAPGPGSREGGVAGGAPAVAEAAAAGGSNGGGGASAAAASAPASPAIASLPQPPSGGAAAPTPAGEPPRFDVVRLGARGTAVVAGRARPGAEVVLLLDGAQEIGRARADSRGEWVILPPEPLAPGARELSLRARLAGEEVAGPDTVVVLVPEKAPQGEAALATAAAAATSAGTARPAVPNPPPNLATRLAEAAAAAGGSGNGGAAAAAAAADAAPAGTGVAAAVPAAGAESAGGARAAAEAVPPPPLASPLAPVGPLAVLLPPPAPLAAGAVAASGATALPRVLQSPEPAAPPAAATAATAAAAARGGEAGAARAGAAGSARGGAVRLGLEVVDYDDSGAMRFAGTAPPGATVRVYVGQRHAGDARADAEGRWVFTPEEPPSYGVHTLRLDQIGPSGSVAARIELPFQRDRLPASAFHRPAAAPAVAAAGRPPRGGAAAAGAAAAQPASADAATPPRASSVVVQPGNNLWRIARQTYGQGVRYTVIYQANREQIRDPDRIYPGQIFALPLTPASPAAGQPAPAESSRSR